MDNFETWLHIFTDKISSLFGNRIVCLGLQGSYGRKEATKSSDIDIVLILDKVDIDDLEKYDYEISQLENRNKICGFVSGKQELICWERSDLFQFYYDTTPIIGDIDFIKPLITQQDIKRAILIGACNIYHICVHNLLHEKDLDILKSLYKSATFVLQAKHFVDTKEYISKKSELLSALSLQDKRVLEICMELKSDYTPDNNALKEYSANLLDWSSKTICKYS